MSGQELTDERRTNLYRPGQRTLRIEDLAIALMTLGTGVLVATPGTAVGGMVRFAVVGAVGLGIMVLLRRVRPLVAALLLAVLGGAAAVGGGVIALPHLLTTGRSVSAIGSAVTALGGLLALGCAAALFVRAVPGWRRLLALPAILIVGYVIYLPLGIAVFATNPPRATLGSVTPADRDLSYRDVSFTSADGVTLSGWYIPSRNQAAVILLPGSGSTRSSVLDHAVLLAHHGYGVLLFDPRGHGGSGGQAMDFGWYGEHDLPAAVTFLGQQPDVNPGRVGAVGLSMGGEQAIGALAIDPRIRVVVAEGATNWVLADKAWLADTYGVRGRIQLGVEAVTYGLADLLTDADPPISLGDAVAAAAPRPVLLIAGGKALDEVPADTAIQARSPDTVQLWAIPDAGHIAGLAVNPTEWETRVTDFLGVGLS
jgi:pimeloyl-ACP methyl ester carboxylesterase